MEKGEPPYTAGCKLVQPLWKAVWKFLKKLKIEIPFHPRIPLVGISPKNAGAQFEKDMHLYVSRSTIYNSQEMEAT